MCLHTICFQGVWSMEGQQPGSGEAGGPRGQRGPVSAPRPRIPARRSPAGEAAEPADHHREPDQEIRNSPPPLRHSGRYVSMLVSHFPWGVLGCPGVSFWPSDGMVVLLQKPVRRKFSVIFFRVRGVRGHTTRLGRASICPGARPQRDFKPSESRCK